MNGPDRHPQRIEVLSGDAAPSCPRCGQEGLISARLPHGWERSNGARTNGTTIVVLCATCDAAHPEAGALITFFTVHGHITEDTLTECAGLLQRWAATIRLPALDVAALDSELAAWRQGTLE
ncbi:MAG TPA: DUF6300 family protein [Streptosporangiaceae bacterium]|nr:DUF6300 family protein [Streptosporangiaceae bacterium]